MRAPGRGAGVAPGRGADAQGPVHTEPVLVSACLLGVPCRYDGSGCRHQGVAAQSRFQWLVPVCPEQLGGLTTPRPRAELQGGDGRAVLKGEAAVVTVHGEDVSAAFRQGARICLELARTLGVRRAILKSRSPACGVGAVYDGSFQGRLRPGDGVLAALFRREGLELKTEADLEDDSPLT